MLPLPHLLESQHVTETVLYRGENYEVPAIYYGKDRIWGATCRILLKLKAVLTDGVIER
jgi:hypothetical protein